MELLLYSILLFQLPPYKPDYRKQLGEYYIGYDYDSFPDPDIENQVTFKKFDDIKINLW